jgi:hypothetical protein
MLRFSATDGSAIAIVQRTRNSFFTGLPPFRTVQ